MPRSVEGHPVPEDLCLRAGERVKIDLGVAAWIHVRHQVANVLLPEAQRTQINQLYCGCSRWWEVSKKRRVVDRLKCGCGYCHTATNAAAATAVTAKPRHPAIFRAKHQRGVFNRGAASVDTDGSTLPSSSCLSHLVTGSLKVAEAGAAAAAILARIYGARRVAEDVERDRFRVGSVAAARSKHQASDKAELHFSK
jgi:hypothetical protein